MNLNPLLGQLSEWLGVIAVSMLAAISPRFQRRPIVFKFNRREVLISLGLFALALLFSFIFYPMFLQALPGTQPVARLAIALLALLPFVVALLVRGQPWRSMGWGSQTWQPAGLVGLALAVLTLFLRGKVFTLTKVSSADWLALLVWLVIALAEETVFRGYIQLRLGSAWGTWRGIAATALLYTIWRIPVSLVLSQNLQTLLLSLLLILLQGLVLGYLMQKTGHVLAPGIYRAFSQWVAMLP